MITLVSKFKHLSTFSFISSYFLSIARYSVFWLYPPVPNSTNLFPWPFLLYKTCSNSFQRKKDHLEALKVLYSQLWYSDLVKCAAFFPHANVFFKSNVSRSCIFSFIQPFLTLPWSPYFPTEPATSDPYAHKPHWTEPQTQKKVDCKRYAFLSIFL